MRRFTCLVSMLVLNLSLPAPAGRASDWPRYRGPDGTGVSADPIPTSFSPKKSLLWKAEIPGVGHSSPIVVGDKV
ncbi:hypothetical protein ACTUQ0_15280, partial [Listeria monocytogenes]|uniref:hypothetical protein n=1 Tax=Listeria monocytogenes TaxID=1639 RepID=UPI003FA4B17F